MILLGLGANLAGPAGPPLDTLAAALEALGDAGVGVAARSRWYRTAPLPLSDQPPFVNAVAALATELAPEALLALLHRIEERFGRRRSVPNAARPIDLDLLAYHDCVSEASGGLVLPHPRMHLRGFVLLPLREVSPRWRHPVLGASVAELLAALPPGQAVEPLAPP